jgi:lytic murein transglycosylase
MCSNDANGFNQWRDAFVKMALTRGISQATLNRTLYAITYDTKVISLDRDQKHFRLSLDEFMKKRGADYVVYKGIQVKAQNRQLLQRIQKRYGVQPGILLAIWGMESSFGRYTGKMRILSSLSTLAYDCRRTPLFTRELLAALQIVQKGYMHPNQMLGAWAGEIGQTQFMASNYLKYAVDFDGDGRRDLIHSKADALASTANLLVAAGWKANQGYQPGQHNYLVLKEWNKAEVYQKALAIIADRIDQKNNTTTPTQESGATKMFFDRL